MPYTAKWQKLCERRWDEIRDAWLADVPNFPSVGAPPDPDLEHLSTLRAVELPDANPGHKLVPDVQGIRRTVLWEAVFLFHKCSHTNLAAQRLGQLGMHSWCMFNAYHSAYLGARGIMALLGVALPHVGTQIAIDLFAQPDSRTQQKAQQTRRMRGLPQFEQFRIVRIPGVVGQTDLWEAFQRVLKKSAAPCLDTGIRRELLNVDHESISPPRNSFLYEAHFWPLGDLMSDATVEEMDSLIGTELSAGDDGFLLRLSFCVYRLFEQLMSDLSEHSPVIKTQFDGSRSWAESAQPEFGRYRSFLSQITSEARAIN